MNRIVSIALLGILAAYGWFRFAHELRWSQQDMDGLSGIGVLAVAALAFIVAVDKT